ncbi:MAG TPA: hypothetical protein DDW55_02575 [Gammaproteobacteria bacterium]|nr:hypothetical protein [Gammaproteobacteria bacterium]
MLAETDPIPNPVVGDSERDAGKPKKEEGFQKPKSELPPNRIDDPEIEDFGIACFQLKTQIGLYAIKLRVNDKMFM